MILSLRIPLQSVFLIGISLSVLLAPETDAQGAPIVQWENPFINISSAPSVSSDSLTLSDILRLVANANPLLQAGQRRIKAAEGMVAQAGLRPNPEFKIEAEEVGGSASGFKESEINIILSQEFELWGKRGARKRLAKSEAEIVRLSVMFAVYDVYASAVGRFFEVVHSQERVKLSLEASQNARSIVETAQVRVERGAALRSEFLLGELEFERAQLNLAQAESDLESARERLSSLWEKPFSSFSVQHPQAEMETLADVKRLRSLIAESREIRALDREEQTTKARADLERSNGKPSLTLSGGVKRLESDNANSFIIGAGLPLPFFNRNQGSTASLKASLEALKLQRKQALTDTETEFNFRERRLAQLASRYQILKTSILPKAGETYSSLESAYASGRIQYSMLLEVRRTLVDLRFELNDTDLAIRQELVALERLLGVAIN